MKEEQVHRNRRVKQTADGSPTIEVPELGVCYHSIHGAVSESMHVFIENGLNRWKRDHAGNNNVRVFELGFGTGLNAALTWMWSNSNEVGVKYVGLEPHPLTLEELNVWAGSGLDEDLFQAVTSMAQPLTNGLNFESKNFTASCRNETWNDWKSDEEFDVCFMDAFAPEQQPELWTQAVFERLRRQTSLGGVLVTYCSKGTVRRAMEKAGWWVVRHPGPPGKREMLIAVNEPIETQNNRVYGLILNSAQTHILVAKERFPDGSVGLKFPGGGVEMGESLEESLWRECYEELGQTEGLKMLGHAYTNDFIVRSAFNKHQQIIASYFWLQSESDQLAWWDEKPEELKAEVSLLEMNWEPVESLRPQMMRFPIDRFVVAQLQDWRGIIQSTPNAG
ncbi:MAG: tRNA (5-methylaminomethyl-2-thiouridine)(34)-methyltransferase MnmD [Flavobacteriales bacterium]